MDFACLILSPKKQLWDIPERRESFTWSSAQVINIFIIIISHVSLYKSLFEAKYCLKYRFSWKKMIRTDASVKKFLKGVYLWKMIYSAITSV